ncbi:MAG: thioesterase family protein [Chitinophagaceae bacterium]
MLNKLPGITKNHTIMFEFITQVRVRYAETDQMNVVYHGNYAQYFEVARAEAIRKLGFTYKNMEALGTYMPITELHCKYLRPAHYDDLLSIKVILKELPPGHRIDFDHEVYNEGGSLLTVGKVVLYFIDAKTNQKTTMPKELHNKLAPFFSSEVPGS